MGLASLEAPHSSRMRPLEELECDVPHAAWVCLGTLEPQLAARTSLALVPCGTIQCRSQKTLGRRKGDAQTNPFQDQQVAHLGRHWAAAMVSMRECLSLSLICVLPTLIKTETANKNVNIHLDKEKVLVPI